MNNDEIINELKDLIDRVDILYEKMETIFDEVQDIKDVLNAPEISNSLNHN